MQLAITGIGIVSALGVGQQANRKQLLANSSHVRSAQILPTIHTEWPMGEVALSNAELHALVSPNGSKAIDSMLSRNALLGAIALKEAIEDAHLEQDQLSELTLINGTTVGGMDTTETLYPAWKQGDYTSLEHIRVHRATENTRLLAALCGITHTETVSTACSSALNAIITGAMMLRSGACKRVVTGGVDTMTLVHLNGFGALGILSEQICRPFAENRDGINLGEGAAYLVLEDADCARRHGASIYGYIGGYANCCDAYHATASSPEGEGAFQAMQQALCMSGLTPSDIAYLNAHGTATPNNDASELRAIERLFAANLPIVESTKPLTGHTTSASGSIEAYFTLIRMQEGNYPYAMTNAFGFGGNDSSMVLSTTPIDLSESMEQCPTFTTIALKEDTDEGTGTFLPALQARRLTPMMRQVVEKAHAVLTQSGISVPDAIVVGTQWGSMIQSLTLLDQMHVQQEQDLSPSLFMNAANNAIAGTIARLLQCKGYNITIMGNEDCWTPAFRHAQLLLQQGTYRHVLVCAFDEQADGWQQWLEMEKCPATNIAKVQLLCID